MAGAGNDVSASRAINACVGGMACKAGRHCCAGDA